ncbi:hypothetical protein P43SY_007465 [Pythium insidiosum]|uniref:Uncharacterized protein n=1 Tax=Pythium insidiosum TaxID=114742 RepID=A0AAD5LFN7_PYTIN|nr:hypothetical protein P43SY_007465 [Pythium insidiosum]
MPALQLLHLTWLLPTIGLLLYLTMRLATNRRLRACQARLLDDDVEAYAEHRMDAVKGEAERGTVICPACRFGNFSRQASDVPYHMIWVVIMILFVWWLTRDLLTSRRLRVCLEQPLLQEGNALDHRIDAANEYVRGSQEGSDLAKLTARVAFASCTLDVDRSYVAASSANDTSTFVHRIRKRLEWQRKVDVRGRVFWYRGPVDGVRYTAPGYVIRFWRDDEDTESTDSDDDDDSTTDEVAQDAVKQSQLY